MHPLSCERSLVIRKNKASFKYPLQRELGSWVQLQSYRDPIASCQELTLAMAALSSFFGCHFLKMFPDFHVGAVATTLFIIPSVWSYNSIKCGLIIQTVWGQSTFSSHQFGKMIPLGKDGNSPVWKSWVSLGILHHLFNITS